MIEALLCSNAKIRYIEMWEDDGSVIEQFIGRNAEEQYPFPNKPIAMICKPEASEYEDTWYMQDIGPAYGALIFVHAEPFSSEWKSLSDEEKEYLEKTIRLQEKGIAL